MKNLNFLFSALLFSVLFSVIFSSVLASAQDAELPTPSEMRLFVAIENQLKAVSAQDLMKIPDSELYQYELRSLYRLSEEFSDRATKASGFAENLMESGNTAYDSISSKISIQKIEAEKNQAAVQRLSEVIELKKDIAVLYSTEGLAEEGARLLHFLDAKTIGALESSFETIFRDALIMEERMRGVYSKHSFYKERLKKIEDEYTLIKEVSLKIRNK